MPEKRIDEDALRRMWAAGVQTREIAATFGVLSPAVCNAARRLGLPRRSPGGYHRKSAPEPEPEKPAAPGYAAIVEMAAANGLTLAQATSRFHRERSGR